MRAFSEHLLLTAVISLLNSCLADPSPYIQPLFSDDGVSPVKCGFSSPCPPNAICDIRENFPNVTVCYKFETLDNNNDAEDDSDDSSFDNRVARFEETIFDHFRSTDHDPYRTFDISRNHAGNKTVVRNTSAISNYGEREPSTLFTDLKSQLNNHKKVKHSNKGIHNDPHTAASVHSLHQTTDKQSSILKINDKTSRLSHGKQPHRVQHHIMHNAAAANRQSNQLVNGPLKKPISTHFQPGRLFQTVNLNSNRKHYESGLDEAIKRNIHKLNQKTETRKTMPKHNKPNFTGENRTQFLSEGQALHFRKAIARQLSSAAQIEREAEINNKRRAIKRNNDNKQTTTVTGHQLDFFTKTVTPSEKLRATTKMHSQRKGRALAQQEHHVNPRKGAFSGMRVTGRQSAGPLISNKIKNIFKNNRQHIRNFHPEFDTKSRLSHAGSHTNLSEMSTGNADKVQTSPNAARPTKNTAEANIHDITRKQRVRSLMKRSGLHSPLKQSSLQVSPGNYMSGDIGTTPKPLASGFNGLHTSKSLHPPLPHKGETNDELNTGKTFHNNHYDLKSLAITSGYHNALKKYTKKHRETTETPKVPNKVVNIVLQDSAEASLHNGAQRTQISNNKADHLTTSMKDRHSKVTNSSTNKNHSVLPYKYQPENFKWHNWQKKRASGSPSKNKDSSSVIMGLGKSCSHQKDPKADAEGKNLRSTTKTNGSKLQRRPEHTSHRPRLHTQKLHERADARVTSIGKQNNVNTNGHRPKLHGIHSKTFYSGKIPEKFKYVNFDEGNTTLVITGSKERYNRALMGSPYPVNTIQMLSAPDFTIPENALLVKRIANDGADGGLLDNYSDSPNAPLYGGQVPRMKYHLINTVKPESPNEERSQRMQMKPFPNLPKGLNRVEANNGITLSKLQQAEPKQSHIRQNHPHAQQILLEQINIGHHPSELQHQPGIFKNGVDQTEHGDNRLTIPHHPRSLITSARNRWLTGLSINPEPNALQSKLAESASYGVMKSYFREKHYNLIDFPNGQQDQDRYRYETTNAESSHSSHFHQPANSTVHHHVWNNVDKTDTNSHHFHDSSNKAHISAVKSTHVQRVLSNYTDDALHNRMKLAPYNDGLEDSLDTPVYGTTSASEHDSSKSLPQSYAYLKNRPILFQHERTPDSSEQEQRFSGEYTASEDSNHQSKGQGYPSVYNEQGLHAQHVSYIPGVKPHRPQERSLLSAYPRYQPDSWNQTPHSHQENAETNQNRRHVYNDRDSPRQYKSVDTQRQLGNEKKTTPFIVIHEAKQQRERFRASDELANEHQQHTREANGANTDHSREKNEGFSHNEKQRAVQKRQEELRQQHKQRESQNLLLNQELMNDHPHKPQKPILVPNLGGEPKTLVVTDSRGGYGVSPNLGIPTSNILLPGGARPGLLVPILTIPSTGNSVSTHPVVSAGEQNGLLFPVHVAPVPTYSDTQHQNSVVYPTYPLQYSLPQHPLVNPYHHSRVPGNILLQHVEPSKNILPEFPSRKSPRFRLEPLSGYPKRGEESESPESTLVIYRPGASRPEEPTGPEYDDSIDDIIRYAQLGYPYNSGDGGHPVLVVKESELGSDGWPNHNSHIPRNAFHVKRKGMRRKPSELVEKFARIQLPPEPSMTSTRAHHYATTVSPVPNHYDDETTNRSALFANPQFSVITNEDFLKMLSHNQSEVVHKTPHVRRLTENDLPSGYHVIEPATTKRQPDKYDSNVDSNLINTDDRTLEKPFENDERKAKHDLAFVTNPLAFKNEQIVTRGGFQFTDGGLKCPPPEQVYTCTSCTSNLDCSEGFVCCPVNPTGNTTDDGGSCTAPHGSGYAKPRLVQLSNGTLPTDTNVALGKPSANTSVTLVQAQKQFIVVISGQYPANQLAALLAQNQLAPEQISMIITTHGPMSTGGNGGDYAQVFPRAAFVLNEIHHVNTEFWANPIRTDVEYPLCVGDVSLIRTPGAEKREVTVFVRNVPIYGTVAVVGRLFLDEEDVFLSTFRTQSANSQVQEYSRRRVACSANWIVPSRGPMFYTNDRMKLFYDCDSLEI